MIESGAYSPDNLVFHQADRPRLREVVGKKIERYGTEDYEELVSLFREHPLYSPPEMAGWFRDLPSRKSFREFLQLDES